MLLQTIAYGIGTSSVGYTLYHLFKNNKKVNLALGVNYCDLSEFNKKQIIDFIENEVKFHRDKGSFTLTYDQLDLNQFDYGVQMELYRLLDKANSPLFTKIEIYNDYIKCYLSDVAKATSFLFIIYLFIIF